jgi:hypothetical protein
LPDELVMLTLSTTLSSPLIFQLIGSTPYLWRILASTFVLLFGIDFYSREKLPSIAAVLLHFGASENTCSQKVYKECPLFFKTLRNLWQLQISKLHIPNFSMWITMFWVRPFIRSMWILALEPYGFCLTAAVASHSHQQASGSPHDTYPLVCPWTSYLSGIDRRTVAVCQLCCIHHGTASGINLLSGIY